MNLTDITIAFLLAAIADLIGDWSTSIARWLIRRAARRLPRDQADRYSEEWLSILHTRVRLLRIFFAADLFFRGSRQMAKEMGGQRPMIAERTLRSVAISTAAGVLRAMLSRLEPESDPKRDMLTGLYNRRYLSVELARIKNRARRSKKEFSVVLADVDHFKRINDEYGHSAGDDVLKGVAKRLQALLPANSCIVRCGGEEFAFVLPNTSIEQAVGFAEKACARCSASTIPSSAGQHRVSVSFGVAASGCQPTVGAIERDIFARADAALYEAKKAGRNCVREWNAIGC